MALEKSIQANILKYLNNLRGCVAENVMGNAAQANRADINCCYKGQLYRIEVKSPDNNGMPTTGQILNLKRWAKSGAICVVVWSLDEVITLIKERGFTEEFDGWYVFQDGIWKGVHG